MSEYEIPPGFRCRSMCRTRFSDGCPGTCCRKGAGCCLPRAFWSRAQSGFRNAHFAGCIKGHAPAKGVEPAGICPDDRLASARAAKRGRGQPSGRGRRHDLRCGRPSGRCRRGKRDGRGFQPDLRCRGGRGWKRRLRRGCCARSGRACAVARCCAGSNARRGETTGNAPGGSNA